MNNLELFIKYADDSLSSDEKVKFTDRLNSDIKFKSEFNLFLENYNFTKHKLEIDERYFTTILPRSRNRIIEEQNKKLKIFASPKLIYSIPVLVFLALFSYKYFTPNSSTKEENNYDSLFYSLNSNLEMSDELIEDALKSDNNYLITQNIYSAIYNENDYDKIIFDYAKENLSTVEITDSLINQLSEDEFNIVYNELINKKIL